MPSALPDSADSDSAGPDRAVLATVGAVAAVGPVPDTGGNAEPNAGDDLGEQVTVHLGPGHPSSHGALRLHLRVQGDRITDCTPEIGFLHRGAEKLFEVRDYRQIMVLANRHDWLSAFANELGVALAVERMLGLEVPPRAVWLRTLLAELNRVLHHLSFLGTFPTEPSGTDPQRGVLLLREQALAVLEELSGGRMHHMFTRIGGLKEDAPAGWFGRVTELTTQLRAAVPRWTEDIVEDPLLGQRTRGVGILSPESIAAYGVSGVAARASGVPLDLRLDAPCLAYGRLADDGVLSRLTREEADAWARLALLLDEVGQSLDLVDACVEELRLLPPGPVNTRLPKIVKAPEGSTYSWTESPGGITGYYLVSRSEKTPWRLALRTPGFASIAALPTMVVGARVADLVPILGSLFFVIGDVDK